MNARFALYNYSGEPTRYFLVNQAEIPQDDTKIAPEVAHHIFVVDRSGSMYYDMKSMRVMLEKLLTIEEFSNSELLCTLISYSSEGDTTTHFKRLKVVDIMAPGSAAIESVRQLHVTGLTCISQALKQAKELIHDQETTCISLHSDGYANDRSAIAERRALDAICTDYQLMPNVFINTIAYRNSSDFKLLAAIANACSGKCLLAQTVKEVYNALHDTSTLLAGQMRRPTKIEIGKYDYQVFVSGRAGRVNGGNADIIVRGLKPDDDRTVFHYLEVDAETFLNHRTPICGDSSSWAPILAFAQAKLAEGHLNTAKYAVMSTRDVALLTHYRALTNIEFASFYEDIDTVLMSSITGKGQMRGINRFYGLGLHKIDVLSLVNILGQYSGYLTVDLEDLYAHYTKRGLKRIPGKRNQDGTIAAPEYDTHYCDDVKTGRIARFEINRNNASLQMLIVRPIELIHRDDPEKTPISKVAGIELKGDNALHAFNNFTVVGDGTLNLSRLRVKIETKKLFRQLAKADIIQGKYDPETWYIINFSDLPLVDFSTSFKDISLKGIFNQLAQAKIFGSLLGSLLKGRSERFTDAQLTELRTYGLSSNLFVSLPTTNAYSSVKDALAKGEIDIRPSYNIDLGSTNILHLGQIKSANANLQRFFTATVNGVASKKPTMLDWWEPSVFDYKKLTARTKITPIDDLMKPIFEDFLGLDSSESLSKILEMISAHHLVEHFEDIIDGTADTDDAIETISEANSLCKSFIEDIYTTTLRPLVFYIGATGLLPDELDTPALTAETISERYPRLKIGKTEREGTFFDLGDDILLSVYIKDVYFATNRKETSV